MATITEEIVGLTGLTIDGTSTPNQTEVQTFIRDGINDVIHRVIEVKPAEIMKFCSTVTSGSDAFVEKTGPVISIVREHDSTSILRPASKIAPEMRIEATDTDSLNYRSKYNPGYYELDGKIYSVPAATHTGNNRIHVTQVTPDEGILYSETTANIANFPNEYGYLVTLYAAIKVVEARMSEALIGEEDSEMVAASELLLKNLKERYDAAFLMLGAKEARQQRGAAG